MNIKQFAFAALCAATSCAAPAFANSQSFVDEYNRQWGLDTINAVPAWQYIESKGLQPGGRGRTIAILDDALDKDHPEFGKRILNSNPVTGNHGNYVAAIAAAEQNGTGIIGVAPYSYLVSANPDTKDEVKTLDNYTIDVFSMSFGADKPDANDLTGVAEFERLKADMQYLFKKHPGAVFVASGGQDGGGMTHGYPAGWASEEWVGGRMIVAGALNRDANAQLILGSFKCNYNDQELAKFCLFAPGDEDVIGALSKTFKDENDKYIKDEKNYLKKVNDDPKLKLKKPPEPEYDANEITAYGTVPKQFYLVEGGGTSAAVPFVAGSIAVIRAVNPTLSAKKVVQIILQTSKIYSGTGDDPNVQPSSTFGWGILDLNAAVQQSIKLKTAN